MNPEMMRMAQEQMSKMTPEQMRAIQAQMANMDPAAMQVGTDHTVHWTKSYHTPRTGRFPCKHHHHDHAELRRSSVRVLTFLPCAVVGRLRWLRRRR
jgi:uncharacterized protein involved in copper resistance